MFQNYLELPAMKSYKNTGGSFGGFYFFSCQKSSNPRCAVSHRAKSPLGLHNLWVQRRCTSHCSCPQGSETKLGRKQGVWGMQVPGERVSRLLSPKSSPPCFFGMLWTSWSDHEGVAGLPSPTSLACIWKINLEMNLPLHPQPHFVFAGAKTQCGCAESCTTAHRYSVQRCPNPPVLCSLEAFFGQHKSKINKYLFIYLLTGVDQCLERSCCSSGLSSHHTTVGARPPMLS